MQASQGKTSSNQDEMMRLLVFYDGQCPFCLGWVRFLLRRDRADRLRFASLQGDWAASFFRANGLDRPDAALPWPWSWGRGLGILPRGLRDGLYRWIARNRYRWFGRHEQCQLPGAGEARKILDQTPASGEEFLP
jgi:predicted DCC family thiol-disulfide oxidoreductase YuxK